MFASLLAATAIVTTPPVRPETEVEEVVIKGEPPTWRIWANVGGDLGRDTLVVSSPTGMECGDFQFRYLASTRQCWVRLRSEVPVVFTARASGRYGVDWTVEWSGCTPRSDAVTCDLVTQHHDTEIGAVFRRLRA